MRVLLINPETNDLNKLPPAGLLTIASLLKNKGVEVKVIDLNVDNEKKLDKTIKDYEPVITAVDCSNPINNLKERMLGLRRGGSLTIAFGKEPTDNPGRFTVFDSVITGDPEKSLVNYVKRPRKGLIKGLAVNINQLPAPAINLVPLKKYKPLINKRKPVSGLITSRGLPAHYDYETKQSVSDYWRPRSVKSLIKEVEQQLSLGVKELCIIDQGFNNDESRIIKLCNEVKSRGLELNWQCPNGLIIEKVSNSMLTKMKEAGCYSIALKPVSGNESILKRLRKKFTLEQLRQVCDWCSELRIKVTVHFTIGHWFETKGSLKLMGNYIKGLKTSLLAINKLGSDEVRVIRKLRNNQLNKLF